MTTDWWVTVRIDSYRTQDYRVTARNAYAAGWLWQTLHPGREVLGVRPASPPPPTENHGAQ